MQPFSQQYQEELIKKMTSKSFMEKTGSLLRAEMFSPDLEPIAREILKGWKDRKQVLSKAQVMQMANRQQIQINWNGKYEESTYHFDHDEVMLWSRDRVLREAFMQAHCYIEDGRHEKAIATVVEARNRFPRNGEYTTPNVLTTKLPPAVRTNILPTGLSVLDDHLKGGIAAGELGSILAPTSGGKSSFLAFLAAQGVLQGKKVWYATLEVSEADIRGKIQRCLMRTAKFSDKQFLEMGKKLERKGADLRVFEAPMYSVEVDSLDGLIPTDTQLVIIDYADYLVNDRTPATSFENLGLVYGALKALAQRRKISVWTASQVNRGAYSKQEIMNEDVAASLRKVEIADIILSLNQDRSEQAPDEETGNSVGRLFISKNRAGQRYVAVDFTVNWALTLFSVGRRA